MHSIAGYDGAPDAVQGCLGTAPVEACSGGHSLTLLLQGLHQLTENLLRAQHRCNPQDAMSGNEAADIPPLARPEANGIDKQGEELLGLTSCI